MFASRIIDNDDDRFDGQTLIVGEQDGDEVWRSWAPTEVDPAIRLNLHHPVAVDDRTDTDTTEVTYRVPSVEEFCALSSKAGDYDADQHRQVAALAVVLDASTLEDAADAVGLPESDLVAEAEAWAIAPTPI